MANLNDEQKHVKETIQKMQSDDRLVISGRAGSGKTYAIANSVADCKAMFVTPTHPARVAIERELTGQNHISSTIHQAIGWHQVRDENLKMKDRYLPAREARRRLQMRRNKSGSLLDVDILIVDEFSMVGSFLFEAVEEYAYEFDLPVVYSGDQFQLPPVNDREVIMHQGFNTLTMSESMRFSAGSEIYQYGEEIRFAIENEPKRKLPCLLGGAELQVVSESDWIHQMKLGHDNGDDQLAVTYKNTRLQDLRVKLGHADKLGFSEGDRVISKQTDNQFQNGEKFTIRESFPDTRELSYVPKCVSNFGSIRIVGHSLIFCETDRAAFVADDDSQLTKIEKRTRDFYLKGKLDHDEASRILDWLEEVNSFELSDLATVHKSQGRTVDTIFIDTADVLKCPNWMPAIDHKRCLYTAVTRARERVVFYEMEGLCQAKSPTRQRLTV